MSVIDAHLHFWDPAQRDYGWLSPDNSKLYQQFLPQTFAPLIERHDLCGVIVVQALDSEEETKDLLAMAHQTSWIMGIVGWVDFDSPTAPSRLAAVSADPLFVGVRPMLQDLQDRRWILDRKRARALDALVDNGLVFDALVRSDQLETIAILADRYADLTIVLDHAGKPHITADGPESAWEDDIGRLASHPNVVCKMSGLLTESRERATRDLVLPYVKHILAEFGSDRVLWGSDWPVLTQVADYDEWLSMAPALLPESVRPAVMGGNAARIYRLAECPPKIHSPFERRPEL